MCVCTLQDKVYKSHKKTFQEMYIYVGMANHEKQPKQEWDDIHFPHIAIPTSFYIINIEVCVLLEYVCINFVHRWCVLWVLEASFCEVAVQ